MNHDTRFTIFEDRLSTSLYSTPTILHWRKLLVVHPVGPGVGLDDVVSHRVDVVAETAEARAAGREVAGAVARDGDEPRLIHRHPRLDLVAELPETYPVVSQRQFRTYTFSNPKPFSNGTNNQEK